MSSQHFIHLPISAEGLDLFNKAEVSQTALDIKKAVKFLNNDKSWQSHRPKKVRILRTFTIEPFLPFFEFSAAKRGFRLEFSCGDFDGIESEMTKVNQDYDLTFVFWRAIDLVPRLFEEYYSLKLNERLDLCKALSERLEKISDWVKTHPAEPIFFSLFYDSNLLNFPSLSSGDPQSLKSWLWRWNLDMMSYSQQNSNFKVYDLPDWIEQEGTNIALDSRMDLYGKIPFSVQRGYSFAEHWSRNLTLMWKPRLKVIAVDLDQTLWGGILGEDGTHGLKIGQEYPGNVYWKIQQKLKLLKATGILLVLLTKNNLSDVEKAFKEKEDMPLKLSDFVEHRINFEPKWCNLKSVAESLNLGIDSFAFIDDSSFEREQMRQFLPTVTILNCDDVPEHLLGSLQFEELDTFSLQKEDLQRHEDYVESQTRNKAMTSATNMEDFLRSLELEIAILEMSEQHVPRVFQMLSKTNQFNLTTYRYSEKDVFTFLSDPKAWVFIAQVKDKFSDQGITGLVILKDLGEGIVDIDTFLLSCRVLGRKVEDTLWNSIACFIKAKTFTKLRATYLKTEKNNQVECFYERMGMSCISSDKNKKQYELNVSELKSIDLAEITVRFPTF